MLSVDLFNLIKVLKVVCYLLQIISKISNNLLFLVYLNCLIIVYKPLFISYNYALQLRTYYKVLVCGSELVWIGWYTQTLRF